jgi:hypothetical protein
MKSRSDTHSVKKTEGIIELKSESDSENGSIITHYINSCLAPCEQCTGIYTDSIRGDILRIICNHQCHSHVECIPNLNDPSKSISNNDLKKSSQTCHKKPEDVISYARGKDNVIHRPGHKLGGIQINGRR